MLIRLVFAVGRGGEGFFAYYTVEYVIKLRLQGCFGYYFGFGLRSSSGITCASCILNANSGEEAAWNWFDNACLVVSFVVTWQMLYPAVAWRRGEHRWAQSHVGVPRTGTSRDLHRGPHAGWARRRRGMAFASEVLGSKCCLEDLCAYCSVSYCPDLEGTESRLQHCKTARLLFAKCSLARAYLRAELSQCFAS